MKIDTAVTNGDLKIILSGRLDSATADDLAQVLEKEQNESTQSLTIDLKDVDFISSKGLRVLVSAYRKLNGKPLTLVSPNASVQDVLRLSGLLKIFQVIEVEQ